MLTASGIALILGSVFGVGAFLAFLSRRATRPWAVVGALLIGPRDNEEGLVDLRFATFLAAIMVLVAVVMSTPGVFRLLAPGELVFLLALALPITACALATLADLMVRLIPYRYRQPLPPTSHRALGRLLEGARTEVEDALRRVQDPDRKAALEALTEAVGEYEGVLRDEKGETARHLRKTLDARLQGVIALARSCVEDERRAAARTLGLSPSATAEEAEALYAALRKLYVGPDALAGTDPSKDEELRAACERMRAQPVGALR